MESFDPTKPARLHEVLTDQIETWHPVSPAEWGRLAHWHDRAQTVINCDGLLYDGWEPA